VALGTGSVGIGVPTEILEPLRAARP